MVIISRMAIESCFIHQKRGDATFFLEPLNDFWQEFSRKNDNLPFVAIEIIRSPFKK